MPHPDAIVAAARGWLGTPYHHQGSVRGAGCDCLGLIRGVWRALYGPEPEAMPPYSRDWGNATGSETLIAAACRHLVRLEAVGQARAGDVLVFRMRDKGVAKHAGILSSGPRFSSAHEPFSDRHPRASRSSSEAIARREFPGGPLGRFRSDREVASHRESQMDCRNRSGNDDGGWHMIHSQEGLGVVEVPLGVWWRRRIVAAFRFPDNV